MMSRDHSIPRRSGFTLLELLVVIVIVGVLGALLLAAFRGAFTASRNTMAGRQLASIAQAVDTFRNDFGYHPPLLVASTNGSRVYRPETTFAGDPRRAIQSLRDARYASEFSLGVYLLGLGDPDGNGTPDTEDDDGLKGPGIKDPGPDRFWGIKGTTGAAPSPSSGARHVITTGRAYGPYLSMGIAEDLIERDPVSGLYRFIDPWGQPIRYYANWQIEFDGERTVSYIPLEIRSPAAVEGQKLNGGEPAWDRDTPVLNAPYALLSAGESPDFDERGRSVPRFGDINSVHDPFDPSDMDERAFNELMRDLESNVRYIP